LSDTDQSETDKQIRRGILQYLVEHPDAKDTLEGIHKWWLSEGQSNWSRDKVQKALDGLTSKGWLTKRGTKPSKQIYGINSDRLEEIKSCLQHVRSRE
jgi:response regulator of citrate/malate metabolism